MLKSNELRWGWVVALGLAIVHCGGKSITAIDSDDSTPSGGSAASAAGNGGATSATECDDAGFVEGGCGGEAGDDPVQSYAALRTGCPQNAIVNRNGKPVAICFRLH